MKTTINATRRKITGILVGAFVLVACGGSPFETCFVAGTKIAGPSGDGAIENLGRGDRVWSYNEKSGAQYATTVEAVHMFQRDVLYEFGAADTKIRATGSHRIFVVEADDYRRIDALEIGDTLRRRAENGTHEVQVTEIHRLQLREPVAVYDLSVSGEDENYFANGILVHNKSISCEAPRLITFPMEMTRRLTSDATEETLVFVSDRPMTSRGLTETGIEVREGVRIPAELVMRSETEWNVVLKQLRPGMLFDVRLDGILTGVACQRTPVRSDGGEWKIRVIVES